MTLKEKFEQVKSPVAIELEKIADDYAIEFAEWVVSRAYGEELKLKDDTLKEFKKEKGL